jgi:hypothetical protein
LKGFNVIRLIFIAFFALFMHEASAKDIHFGMAIGGNFAKAEALNLYVNSITITSIDTSAGMVYASGFGYSATATASFYQEKMYGFQFGADYLNIDAGDNRTFLKTNALIVSTVGRIGVDFLGLRNFLGLGIGYCKFFNPEMRLGVERFYSTLPSLIIEAKTSWKLDDDKNLFTTFRPHSFFATGGPMLTVLNLLVGVDF